jgi:glycosyltransferase involved in cell wall biosynthesis
VLVTIPCYNEALRLDGAQVDALLSDARFELLFVDDGSRDGTKDVLAALCERHAGRASYLVLPQNRGKAEAVRTGLRTSLERGAEVVGYYDADFATPPRELSRLADELERAQVDVVMGSRVARVGAEVERHPTRHYMGRLFATTASLVLDLPIYDTQCGAKLFRRTAALDYALEAPFSSRWAFDVELLGRLLAGGEGVPPLRPEQLVEVPLSAWHDVEGSKLGSTGMLRAGTDLLRLAARVRARGKRGFFP